MALTEEQKAALKEKFSLAGLSGSGAMSGGGTGAGATTGKASGSGLVEPIGSSGLPTAKATDSGGQTVYQAPGAVTEKTIGALSPKQKAMVDALPTKTKNALAQKYVLEGVGSMGPGKAAGSDMATKETAKAIATAGEAMPAGANGTPVTNGSMSPYAAKTMAATSVESDPIIAWGVAKAKEREAAQAAAQGARIAAGKEGLVGPRAELGRDAGGYVPGTPFWSVQPKGTGASLADPNNPIASAVGLGDGPPAPTGKGGPVVTGYPSDAASAGPSPDWTPEQTAAWRARQMLAKVNGQAAALSNASATVGGEGQMWTGAPTASKRPTYVDDMPSMYKLMESGDLAGARALLDAAAASGGENASDLAPGTPGQMKTPGVAVKRAPIYIDEGGLSSNGAPKTAAGASPGGAPPLSPDALAALEAQKKMAARVALTKEADAFANPQAVLAAVEAKAAPPKPTHALEEGPSWTPEEIAAIKSWPQWKHSPSKAGILNMIGPKARAFLLANAAEQQKKQEVAPIVMKAAPKPEVTVGPVTAPSERDLLLARLAEIDAGGK
jgi:hypothetical protein